jgi:hypothetical protein
VAKHTIFWLVWIGGFTFIQSFGFGIRDYLAWLGYYSITLPLFMTHTYAIAYWLVPKYFFRHRYLLFSFWVLVLFIVASVSELVLSNELIWKLLKPENIYKGNYLEFKNVLINGIGNEYVILAFLSVKVVQFWNSKTGERTNLLNQKLANEIELLQYQSYPTFVLNLMERLESLAVSKSAKTSEMIIRLSNLMSSMTLSRDSDKILLQKEIELIRSYIDIHRMNFPEHYDVSFMVTGELNGIKIPPFLFFQVVEEGFIVLDDFSLKTDYTILIKSEPHYLLFSLTLWNDDMLTKEFNQEVLENSKKYLQYFYAENHKIKSSLEINFVEITIEIYL